MRKTSPKAYIICSLIGVLMTLFAAASVSTVSCWLFYQPKAPKNLKWGFN